MCKQVEIPRTATVVPQTVSATGRISVLLTGGGCRTADSGAKPDQSRNAAHKYLVEFQGDMYIYQTRINSYISSHTDGGGCHARPAHQGQFGVQYLAQGHFDMQTLIGQ